MKSPEKTVNLHSVLSVIAALFFMIPVALFLAGPASSSPQAPSAPPQQPAPPRQKPGIVIKTNQVLLPVTVKDSAGNLVPDLRKQDFRIFEDNVEQHVEFFSAEVYPLSLVILIDNDLKDKDAAEVQPSLDAILAGMSTDDEAFVCRFDQFFHPGTGFTTDQDSLLTQLHRTRLDSEPSAAPPGGPFYGPSINGKPVENPTVDPYSSQLIKGQPTKALDDAVYAADQLLSTRGIDRRKVILLISDGVNGGKKFNKNSYETVVKALLHDNVSVYSVAVASAYLNRKLSRLEQYAHASGGDVYFSAKRDTLERLYSQVTEQARNQYTLGYTPQGTDRNSDYHSIEVRVERPDLNVKTRQGYFTGAAPGITPP